MYPKSVSSIFGSNYVTGQASYECTKSNAII
jgi:hypothetical protein